MISPVLLFPLQGGYFDCKLVPFYRNVFTFVRYFFWIYSYYAYVNPRITICQQFLRYFIRLQLYCLANAWTSGIVLVLDEERPL
jgi:hypothetical protein